MDDHMWYWVHDYANCELIPRFQDEYAEYGKMDLCPSYQEMLDFCKVLSIIGKYSGFRSCCPSQFLDGKFKI